MTAGNKRKSRPSMSPQSSVKTKRRPSVRSRANTTTPGAFPQSPTPSDASSVAPPVLAPYLARKPRPARWRKSHAEARQPVLDPPVLESIYRSPSPESEPVSRYSLRPRQQQQPQEQQHQEGIELRFSSFSRPADEEDPATVVGLRRNVFREAQEARAKIEDPEVVNRSFSNLSVDQDAVTQASPYRERSITPTNGPRPPYQANASATAAWARQTSEQMRRSRSPEAEPVAAPRIPTIPELSKPKRGGYGFSYSDSDFYDSDEYPDTEVGSEPNFITQANSASAPGLIFPDDSFEATVKNSSFGSDVVVVREVGSFHYARPQRRLACTTATREDTLRLKVAAKALLKYDESQDIYGALVSRVERMVKNTLRDNGGDTSAAMLLCASKLLNFLQRMAIERLEHGEPANIVIHEIQWAKWLVEASHTGVMHIKGVGCQCQPDWEE